MKVLVVHNQYFEFGGEDIVVENTVRLLQKYGHDVVMYIHSNREIREFSILEKVKFAIHDVVWSKKTYREMKILIQKEKPDIVHTHNIFVLISPSVYDACHDMGVPVVHTFHNYRVFCANGNFFRNGRVCLDCISGKYSSALVHRCWRNSFLITATFIRMLRIHSRRRTFQNKVDAFIALTDFGKKLFVQGGIPAEKIHICSNFVDVKRQEDRDIGDFAVFAGRLVQHKGIFTLVKAFEKIPHCRLVIIGDGPAFNDLKKMTKNMEHIQLVGRLSYIATMECLKKASLMVFPSEWYEGAPLIVIESLAYGIPVLISDVAFRGVGISANSCGLEFAAGNSDDLARKAERLMSDRATLRQMGRNARKLYEENYTPDKSYQALMRVYSELTSVAGKNYV